MPRLFHCHATGIMWLAMIAIILLPTYTGRVLMAFDFACVCSCGNKVLRPAFSLDRPDLTATVLILFLAGSVRASDMDSLMCSLSRCSPFFLLCSVQLPPPIRCWDLYYIIFTGECWIICNFHFRINITILTCEYNIFPSLLPSPLLF